MKHKRSGKKDYDSVVSPRNTPHLREKTIIIGMSFFFAGINFLFTGVRGAKVDGTLGRCFAIVGIVLILMSPISMVDPRRENRGRNAAEPERKGPEVAGTEGYVPVLTANILSAAYKNAGPVTDAAGPAFFNGLFD